MHLATGHTWHDLTLTCSSKAAALDRLRVVTANSSRGMTMMPTTAHTHATTRPDTRSHATRHTQTQPHSPNPIDIVTKKDSGLSAA
jgi:hypothetical protein